MRRLYTIFGILTLLGYSFMEVRGLEFRRQRRELMAQGLRSAAHGGYRSYWSSGFHGGK